MAYVRYSGSDKYIQGTRPDRMPEALWTEVADIVQEAVIKTIPRKRNAKRQKLCKLHVIVSM